MAILFFENRDELLSRLRLLLLALLSSLWLGCSPERPLLIVDPYWDRIYHPLELKKKKEEEDAPLSLKTNEVRGYDYFVVPREEEEITQLLDSLEQEKSKFDRYPVIVSTPLLYEFIAKWLEMHPSLEGENPPLVVLHLLKEESQLPKSESETLPVSYVATSYKRAYQQIAQTIQEKIEGWKREEDFQKQVYFIENAIWNSSGGGESELASFLREEIPADRLKRVEVYPNEQEGNSLNLATLIRTNGGIVFLRAEKFNPLFVQNIPEEQILAVQGFYQQENEFNQPLSFFFLGEPIPKMLETIRKRSRKEWRQSEEIQIEATLHFYYGIR